MAVVNRQEVRARRKRGIRKKVRGTANRPRLAVYRSLKHIYAQVIDDENGKVLAHASSLDGDIAKLIQERNARAEKELQEKEGADKDEKAPAESRVAISQEEADPGKGKKKKKKDKGKGKKAAMKAQPKQKKKTLRYRPGPATGKILQAIVVGEVVAARSLEKGVSRVVFDRNGFHYHGRVAALADGARAKGLKF